MVRKEREFRKPTTERVSVFQQVLTIYNDLAIAKEHELGGPDHQNAMKKMTNILANRRGAVQALFELQGIQSRENNRYL